MTSADAIGELVVRAVGADAALGDALHEAIDAMRRLAAIRSRHQQGAVTTDAGSVIYTDIRGKELHRLLYGELDEKRD